MTAAPETTSMERAAEAWGDNMPDWIRFMARECDRTSQSRVARRIGRSPGLVNAVLGQKYASPLRPIENAVRKSLMRFTVLCPVLGNIETADCVEASARRAPGVNMLQVALRRTCPSCPENIHRKDAK